MLTHRMVAARGELSSSQIAQAPSIAAHSGRFVTFEESATNFTDKIADGNFIAFPQGVDAADFDADVTEQNKPTIYSGGVGAVACAADWADVGSNDFLLMVCAEAIVAQEVTMSPSTNVYTPTYADAGYGGCIAAYVGGSVGSNYSRCDVQPYRFRFRYGSDGAQQIATAWNSKWRTREHGKAYCFAGGRRGNTLLHFAYKEGESTGEVAGSRAIDPAEIDTILGSSEFSTRWGATKFSDACGFTHSSYGAYSTMCNLSWTDPATGKTKWLTDNSGAECGNPLYPAWTVEDEPSFVVETAYPRVDLCIRDTPESYQMVDAATPIAGENAAPVSAAVNHPAKYYFVALLEFPNGLPNDVRVCNALRYMTDRAIAGDKVIDPGLLY